MTLPAHAMRYNFEAANVTKVGGNLIATVNDLSGVGRHLTQATDARKMLWVDNGSPNSLLDIGRSTPDGTDGEFESRTDAPGLGAAFTAASGYTAYVVFKRTAGSIFHPLFIHNNNAVRGGWQLEFNSGTRQMQARTSAGTAKTVTFGAYSNGTLERWIVRNYGGGSDDVASDTWFKVAINGVNTAWSGNPWFWVPITTFLTLIGNNVVTSGPVVEFCEAGSFAAYLSDQQVALLDSQLQVAYGP